MVYRLGQLYTVSGEIESLRLQFYNAYDVMEGN